MHRSNRFIVPLLFLLIAAPAIHAQEFFSIASDLSLQRNFKRDQRYWAFGHNTQFIVHINERDGAYFMFSFFSRGKFHNTITAPAKDPLTVPAAIQFENRAKMGLKQVSIGYHRYLKGTADAETGWNLYAKAGFGLVMGRVVNEHRPAYDTTVYTVPVRAGEGRFKRLSWDLALGVELPLAADFIFYTEARTWIPASDYPSKYIFINRRAPIPAMLGAGIRLLF